MARLQVCVPSESSLPVNRQTWAEEVTGQRINVGEDIQKIGEVPCARSSLLYGIGGGSAIGAVRYLGSRSRSTHRCSVEMGLNEGRSEGGGQLGCHGFRSHRPYPMVRPTKYKMRWLIAGQGDVQSGKSEGVGADALDTGKIPPSPCLDPQADRARLNARHHEMRPSPDHQGECRKQDTYVDPTQMHVPI